MQSHSPQQNLAHAALNLFEIANWHGLKLTCDSETVRIEKPETRSTIVVQHGARIVAHLISLFDRYVGMVEATSREGSQAIFDFTNPRLHRFRNSDLAFWFSSIPEDAYPVPGYLSRYRPKKGESVLDLGACSGVTSYFLSKLVGPEGRVFAYEPDALNFAMLERNIAFHQLQNVIPIKKAVWTQMGTVDFSVTGGTTGSIGAGETTVTVPAVSLQQAVADAGGPAVTLVKMDVEGAEVDILESAQDYLRSADLRFAIASYHIVGGVSSSEILEKLFAECGYAAKTGFPMHPTTWAWPQARD